ncbi:MAG TPA: hypothetical protein VGP37_04840 [Candidatus Nanopelagicales bacterium]|nr:hypothetical protein [Candidatus Nanopelagicales bacterium]
MPGIDAREAMNIVAGEFADFVPLVELPARGPGADHIGRTASLLAQVDRSFEVETMPSGWRLGHTGQRELSRARGFLSQDIDALEEFAGSATTPIKVAIAGPWTLSAGIADQAGEALLRDPGAVADITGALAQAVTELIDRLRRGLNSDSLVIQIDEDIVPRVLGGQVRTSSGRLTHRHVEPIVVQGHVQTVVEAIHAAGARSVLRCFASRAPVDLLRETGTDALAVDLALAVPEDDALPRAWEAGTGLLLGCVPVRTDVGALGDTAVSAELRRFMTDCGFASVPDNVAITPHRGLADMSMDAARDIIRACNAVGSVVRDDRESAGAT